MVKERQDITGSNCLKGVSGKVIVDDKGVKDSSKEYMEKMMNEENAKFRLDRFIPSPSVGENPNFAVFGLRHLVLSPIGNSLVWACVAKRRH